jgi:hypothetical protein
MKDRHWLRSVLPDPLAKRVPGPVDRYEVRFAFKTQGYWKQWETILDEWPELEERVNPFPKTSETPIDQYIVKCAVSAREFDGYARCVPLNRANHWMGTVWKCRIHPALPIPGLDKDEIATVHWEEEDDSTR